MRVAWPDRAGPRLGILRPGDTNERRTLLKLDVFRVSRVRLGTLMVPNWQRKLMVGLVGVLLMVACTSGNGETTTSVEGMTTTTSLTGDPDPGTSQPVEDKTLLVWVDETRAPVVEAAAERFEAASGIVVEVEVMPFREIRGAVVDAVPAGQGPDLFIDSNEGTGALVEAGIIAPLDLAGRQAEFVSVAVDGLSYGGQVFGLPFVTESVGLFYNKDFVQEPPGDFDALRVSCDGLGFPTAEGLPCLAIPVGEPLHQFPFIGGFGGYVFGFGNGAFDVTDVGIDSPEAIAGAVFLNALYRDGYAKSAVDYSMMADLFNQGAVPFMWTGPWQVDAVDAAGINYGIAPLPLMAGNVPRPFVGSQGFFLQRDDPEIGFGDVVSPRAHRDDGDHGATCRRHRPPTGPVDCSGGSRVRCEPAGLLRFGTRWYSPSQY